jgi:hypothetical protein
MVRMKSPMDLYDLEDKKIQIGIIYTLDEYPKEIKLTSAYLMMRRESRKLRMMKKKDRK